jgi:hypothetical protein
MRRTKVVLEETPVERQKTKTKPALTPEGRENQLVSMAYDLAEKHLREGTATSQEICHFLRMGSPNTRLEQENLRLKKEKMEAEIEQIHSQRRVEELYANALAAMKSYGLHSEED